MTFGNEYLLIGALRRVAKEKGSMRQALLGVAQEIEDGISARNRGDTETLTFEQLLDGQLIGDPIPLGDPRMKPKRLKWWNKLLVDLKGG